MQRLDHSWWREPHTLGHRSMHRTNRSTSYRTGHGGRSGSSSNHSCWLHSSSKQERHRLGHKRLREQHSLEHSRYRHRVRSWQRELHKREHNSRLGHSWQQELHKLEHSWQQELHRQEHS